MMILAQASEYIPANSIVELYGGEPILMRTPTEDGLLNFGISATDIESGEIGKIIVDNVAVLKITESVEAGDGVGAQNGSFIGKKDETGLVVIGETGISNLYYVKFTGGPFERIEVVIPEIECAEDGSLTYDTKFIWVAKVEEEGS